MNYVVLCSYLYHIIFNTSSIMFHLSLIDSKLYSLIHSKEFLCAINGHVMKNPVKVRSSGLVFEEATIDLWLNTRGSVCPITNTYLDRSDLLADDELRNRYVYVYIYMCICIFICMCYLYVYIYVYMYAYIYVYLYVYVYVYICLYDVCMHGLLHSLIL